MARNKDLTVRLPEAAFAALKDMSQRTGVSMSTIMLNLLAEKIGTAPTMTPEWPHSDPTVTPVEKVIHRPHSAPRVTPLRPQSDPEVGAVLDDGTKHGSLSLPPKESKTKVSSHKPARYSGERYAFAAEETKASEPFVGSYEGAKQALLKIEPIDYPDFRVARAAWHAASKIKLYERLATMAQGQNWRAYLPKEDAPSPSPQPRPLRLAL